MDKKRQQTLNIYIYIYIGIILFAITLIICRINVFLAKCYNKVSISNERML